MKKVVFHCLYNRETLKCVATWKQCNESRGLEGLARMAEGEKVSSGVVVVKQLRRD